MSRIDNNHIQRSSEKKKFWQIFMSSMTTNAFFRERIIFMISLTIASFIIGIFLGKSHEAKSQATRNIAAAKDCLSVVPTKKMKPSEPTTKLESPSIDPAASGTEVSPIEAPPQ